MATAQNGWPAGTAAQIGAKPYDVPGPSTVKLVLAPNAAPILLYFAAFWDAKVEDIDVNKQHLIPDDWGGAFRDIRGDSTELSNHAAWAAMDINATQYPRGTSHMSATKKRKIRAELKHVNDLSKKVNNGQILLSWGGDYVRSPIDQMHVELANHTTPADVRRVMRALEDEKKPKINMKRLRTALTTKNKLYAPGSVVRVQRALHAKGYLGGYIPGRAGENTRVALTKYLKKRNGRKISEMTAADIRSLVGPTFDVS